MDTTAKCVLYYNIIDQQLYNENGEYMGNSPFNVFFDNITSVELHYVTDTSSDNMDNWIPWTGLQGNTVGSSICFDDDYLHAKLGQVSEQCVAGTSKLKVSVALEQQNVNPSGVLLVYTVSGQSSSYPYTGYFHNSGIYTFQLESNVSENISAGTSVRVPQALLLKINSDEIDHSGASVGIFSFDINSMSHKLLNRLDYSNITRLDGMFEHQIYSDGKNIATFSFPMSVTNLIDYHGQANVPKDGTWADKAYVDSKIITKTSELQNDAGFISQETDPVYNTDKPNIALKSELFSKKFQDLTDKPETLAGYGITDVTINQRVITLGQKSVAVPEEVTSDFVKSLIGVSQTGNPQKVLNQKGQFVYTPAVYTVNGVKYDINGNVQLSLQDIISEQDLIGMLPKYVKSVNGNTPDTDGDVTLDLSDFQFNQNALDVYLGGLQTRVQNLQNGGTGGGSSSISVNGVQPVEGEITLTMANFQITVGEGQASMVVEDMLKQMYEKVQNTVLSVCNQTPDDSGNIQLQASAINYSNTDYPTVGLALDSIFSTLSQMQPGSSGVLSVDGNQPNQYGDVQLQYLVNGNSDFLANILNNFQGRIQQLQQNSGGSGGQVPQYSFEYPLEQSSGVVSIDLSNYARVTDIPSNVSAFNNDVGYITINDVPSVDLTPYALKSELFSKSFNDLTGKPTTLAGYGITDASISGRTIMIGGNSITVPESGSGGEYTLTKEAVDGVIGASTEGSTAKFYNEQGAFTEVDMSGYLPLSGGTITDNLQINGSAILNIRGRFNVNSLATFTVNSDATFNKVIRLPDSTSYIQFGTRGLINFTNYFLIGSYTPGPSGGSLGNSDNTSTIRLTNGQNEGLLELAVGSDIHTINSTATARIVMTQSDLSVCVTSSIFTWNGNTVATVNDITMHNEDTIAHADLLALKVDAETYNAAITAINTTLEGKENTGVAQGLVDAHNESSTAHEALFEAKADKTELELLQPAGTVIAFAGNSAPTGYLICNGAAVSRTTYAKLFAVIGTTYGVGDGSTTFNLPNLIDKFIMGSATAGTTLAAGLPNITGTAVTTYFVFRGINTGALLGAATGQATASSPMFDTSAGNGLLTLDASSSNSIYGNSTTVQPPALTMRFYIKY